MTDLMTHGHIPVLQEEAMAALNLHADGLVVDATYGGGGHTRAILARLGGGGRVLALDRDPRAVAQAHRTLGGEPRVEVVHAPFSQLQALLAARHLSGRVTAMLFDLGVSSQQLDEAARGFSFRADGPLDMRMDPTCGASAMRWLQGVDEGELADVLRRFGEQAGARRIARRIKQAMREGPINTTVALADVVAAAAPRPRGGRRSLARHHPATRTFQAIRIAVNDELGELRRALPQAVAALAAGGRLVVISFHSLEDRMVKRFFRDQARGDFYPPQLAITERMKRPTLTLVGKAHRPSAAEVAHNRRARSAVLRVAEKRAVTS